jgi:hypothetical protein
VLPYPVFAGPGADPSWNQDAAHTFILSFRVSRGCDLRRPVVDSVADGTLAA